MKDHVAPVLARAATAMGAGHSSSPCAFFSCFSFLSTFERHSIGCLVSNWQAGARQYAFILQPPSSEQVHVFWKMKSSIARSHGLLCFFNAVPLLFQKSLRPQRPNQFKKGFAGVDTKMLALLGSQGAN